MTSGSGLVGNGDLLLRIRSDGVVIEAYYPSIGFFRHIVQSQFAAYLADEGQCVWLSQPDFTAEQRYLEGTNVLATTFARPGLEAELTDFVVPDAPCLVRTLRVRNTSPHPRALRLFHAEAMSVSDHRGEFRNNVAWFDALRGHVVRFRGHPWDNSQESQVVWLIGSDPPPESFQCGTSYQEEGESLDAFFDVRNGKLRENGSAAASNVGTTTALQWNLSLAPGESASVTVYFCAGMSRFEAEDALDAIRRVGPELLLGRTVVYWRDWLQPAERGISDLPSGRLRALYLRSLLLLKLLQDRKYGALIAAPTLDPDYRYCWPRDGVFMAWALDRCGYHSEARRFYDWCRRTQAAEGHWHQNYYTDGRLHWGGVQVDQVGSVCWGVWRHFRATRRRELLVDLWPTVRRATEYLIARTDPGCGLVYSEQDLWEETDGYLAYTNGAAVAGLRSAARVARELGHETEAGRWRAASMRLREAVCRELVQDGAFVGEREPCRSFPMRLDYALDISILGLSVPFRVIPADDPAMLKTAAMLEGAAEYPVGGIGRYASDLFMGGNPWSLSALWLGLYRAELGQADEVYRQLNWCLKHATDHDFLPEQSHKSTGLISGASPLGWSHAWVIVLIQRLRRLVRSVPELRAGHLVAP